MQIILLSRFCRKAGGINLYKPGPILLGSLLLSAVAAGLVSVGYQLGKEEPAEPASPNAEVLELQKELDSQRDSIERAKSYTQEHMDALAQRLGQMQAHIMRLDALGERLTDMADLQAGEFDFSAAPSLGGGDDGLAETLNVTDFLKLYDSLSLQIQDRERQLGVLEDMLRQRSLHEETQPAGKPVKSGWISSPYGRRIHPISGKKHHHSGVDFAGRYGSDVIAVASGVVMFSGYKSGYGRIVEINHGSGLETRYAHNQKNLVKVGQTVKQGDVIALLGSSGRSTGPHVHFEVIRNGRNINPTRYIRAQRE